MFYKLILKLLNKISNAYLYRNNYKIYSPLTIIRLILLIFSGKLNSFPYPSNNVKKFTNNFLNFHKSKRGLCVTNGTDALKVVLKILKLKWGDEIIFSSLTYHTTASVAIELGLRPVFVDMNPEDLSFDLKDLKKKITKKTKAIVLVHLGCAVNDISNIMKICKDRNLFLIEDCAHTHGAQFNNKPVGTFGDFGIFSFQQSKLISSGEGGFVIIKKKEHYDRGLSLINCGRGYKKPNKTLGINLRMTEIQAIILNYKLNKFKKKINVINRNIDFIVHKIKNFKDIKTINFNKNYNLKSSYFFPLRLKKKLILGNKKEKFIKECNSLGLNIKKKLYDPVYLNPEFGYLDNNLKLNYKKGNCQKTEDIILKEFIWIDFLTFSSSKFFVKIAIYSLKKALSELKK